MICAFANLAAADLVDAIEEWPGVTIFQATELADVVFPFGAYWMRKFGKVVCETAEMVGETIRDQALHAELAGRTVIPLAAEPYIPYS
jgi:hypothetical protein